MYDETSTKSEGLLILVDRMLDGQTYSIKELVGNFSITEKTANRWIKTLCGLNERFRSFQIIYDGNILKITK